MREFVFIASGWGAKQGGVNAFNYDLACAVSKYSKDDTRIVCVVETATAEEINEAKNNGVLLYHTSGRFNSASIIRVIREKGHKNVCCWIGHDIITGMEANECRDLYNDFLDSRCLSGAIHHMDYLSYYSSKTNNATATYSKHNLQKDIFSKSELVFAVGPYLRNSAENILKEAEVQNEVVEILPGILDLKNVNINQPFRVVSYGRLGDEDEIVKQGKLAVAAFSEMCKHEELNDSELTIIGLDESKYKEKHSELYGIGFEYGGKLLKINGLPYINREQIYPILKSQSVSLMLSTHEGFGLAGWEAISAEIPLILSIDTGLYKFIETYLGGPGVGCIFPVKITGKMESDLSVVSKELLKVKKDLITARRNAVSLKNQLQGITWENTVVSFVSHIILRLKVEEVNEVREERQRIVEEQIPVSSEQSSGPLSCPLSLERAIYYSTSTYISSLIAEIYYNNRHYVWCTPNFNPAKTNPASANPYEIYKALFSEVESGTAGPTITKHKTGLLNGAKENKKKGVISQEQEDEILEIIASAEVKYFKPVIYIIPINDVKNIIRAIPRNKRAGVLSQEFLIEELERQHFDIIDLE